MKKKFFTLMTLLLCLCSTGAWGDEVIFSMTAVTNGKTSVTSGSNQSITATFNTGSSALVHNGHKDAKEMITSKNLINIGGSSASYFKASFTSALAAGDVVTSSTENTFYINGTDTKSNSAVTFPYTIKSTDTDLIGKTVLYVWKSGGSSFSTFTITRVTGTHAPSIEQDGTSVTLTCATEGATIYYTTDGSEPTTSSSTYSSAIALTNSCTVRAFAKKGDEASDLVKKDCYLDNSSADNFIAKLGYSSGSVDGDVWTGTNFTLTNNVADRGIGYANLAGTQDGFKLNHTDTYTLQPSEGIKVTKLIVVGKTWLEGSEGNASVIAFDGFTPASGTFFDYLTDGETYVKTIEFTPSEEQTYGQAITITPSVNQLGAYIEVYGQFKTFAITYNAGSYGTGSIAAGEKTYNVDFTLSSSKFTRDGYVQTGWATSDGGAKVYDLGGTYSANATITLYPVWAKGGETTYNYTDGKTIAELESAGWTFNSAEFDADPTDAEAYVNLVSAMNTAGLTAPKSNSMEDNAIAFAKNTGAYAMYDLGSAKTVSSMSATLYGGSSSSFDQTIEYIGSDGTTVKKTYTNALNAGNWKANSINKTDVVSGVQYIKIYGATKWVVMYDFSVTTVDAISVSTLADRNYASYVTPAGMKLDFDSADGITAYIATGFNVGKDAIVLQSVDVVPASTPIIMKTTTQGATVDVNITDEEASSVEGNALVAGDGTTAWNGTTDYTYYYLASDQFHQATSGTLQSGKAYLKVLTSEVPAARAFGFVLDSETTGIQSVSSDKKSLLDGDFYNLAGQRVAQPQKGLYIVNGKKVIIK